MSMVTTWGLDVCHELSMCHVNTYIKMKFLVSECLSYFLKIPSNYNHLSGMVA